MSWQCRGIDGGFGGWRLEGGDLVRGNGEGRGVLSYLGDYYGIIRVSLDENIGK